MVIFGMSMSALDINRYTQHNGLWIDGVRSLKVKIVSRNLMQKFPLFVSAWHVLSALYRPTHSLTHSFTAANTNDFRYIKCIPVDCAQSHLVGERESEHTKYMRLYKPVHDIVFFAAVLRQTKSTKQTAHHRYTKKKRVSFADLSLAKRKTSRERERERE